jgi:hypothetical protein
LYIEVSLSLQRAGAFVKIPRFLPMPHATYFLFYFQGILELEKKFDIKFCQDWMTHIGVVQKEVSDMSEKVKVGCICHL